jgi:hypothetical protein
MRDLERELDELFSNQPFLEPLPQGRFVVYGAGNVGREIATELARSGREVSAYLDLKPLGVVDGIPVHLPSSGEARRRRGWVR